MEAHSNGVDDHAMSNSSDPLSSPPGSPELVPAAAIYHPSPNVVDSRSHGFSGVAPPNTAPASTTSAPNPSISASTTTASAPVPKKGGRKKKEVNPEQAAAKAIKEPKEPKKTVRKPRAPKDPNAPPPQRKRLKTEASQPPPIASIPPTDANMAIVPPAPNGSTPSRQPTKIADLVSNVQVNPQQPTTASYARAPISQGPTTPTPHTRPASSGQIFDPIRGSTVEAPPVSPTPFFVNRASASPSIKSLIDPTPPTSQPSRMSSTSLSGPQLIKSSKNSYPAPPATVMPPTSNGPTIVAPTPSKPSELEDIKPKKVDNGSAPSSSAPTPPPKQKFKEPPPLPTGSGLLSGTPWGGIQAPNEGSGAPKGSNIWLTFEIKGKENVTINFSHEVENKYGLGALNPRLAARKERQRQVALASSELEKAAGLAGSADDMSIDGSEPESNNDTDVVMKEADAPAPGKRRKRKAEDYDRHDEFIDDAELLLEEQALMAKDGFFVYSGPLLEEGERPAIERYFIILFLTYNHSC
jgi:hypothetical protein